MDFQSFIENTLLPFALQVGIAIIIFFVGQIVARFVLRYARRIMEMRKMDELLIRFILNITNIALQIVIIIAALNSLGVDTTALVALFGVLGLAVGLAVQDSISNLANGVLLIFFRPFTVGQVVELNGIVGTVYAVNLFSTVIHTGDNREVILPNSNVAKDGIINFSTKPQRRVDLVFGIGYEDNIQQARELIMNIMNADDRILSDPEPTVTVGELADSSVNLNVRPWVNNSDYWGVYFDMQEKVKQAFDSNNISIPFPQVDVHVNPEQIAS